MSNDTQQPPCVRCGAPLQTATAPFCSAGCKDRDLLDWFDGRHVLPGTDDAETLDNIEPDA